LKDFVTKSIRYWYDIMLLNSRNMVDASSLVYLNSDRKSNAKSKLPLHYDCTVKFFYTENIERLACQTEEDII
jgi:hypothetical protein